MYYEWNLIKDIDINNYHINDTVPLYIKDTKNVYLKGKKLANVVSDDFRFKQKYFFNHENIYCMINNHNVYIDWKQVYWADPNSFEIIDYIYAKDKNYYYENNKIIFWFSSDKFYYDPHNRKSFTLQLMERWLKHNYLKDENNLYFNWKVIKYVDRNTFEIIDSIYSKDKNNLYYHWQVIVGIDMDSFKIMNFGYVRDKDNVFFGISRMEWANSDTFKVIDFESVIDKYSKYKSWNKQVICSFFRKIFYLFFEKIKI